MGVIGKGSSGSKGIFTRVHGEYEHRYTPEQGKGWLRFRSFWRILLGEMHTVNRKPYG